MTDRVPCKACGAEILPSTAKATGGICMPCKQGRRSNIEASKKYYEEERSYDAAQGRPSAPEMDLPKTLHWAIEICQDTNKLSKALASGIDINARDEVGATALHKMAALGRVGAVKNLLTAGADPKIRLNSGSTTVDILSHNVKHEAEHKKEATEQILRLFHEFNEGKTDTKIVPASYNRKREFVGGAGERYCSEACYNAAGRKAAFDMNYCDILIMRSEDKSTCAECFSPITNNQ